MNNIKDQIFIFKQEGQDIKMFKKLIVNYVNLTIICFAINTIL